MGQPVHVSPHCLTSSLSVLPDHEAHLPFLGSMASATVSHAHGIDAVLPCRVIVQRASPDASLVWWAYAAPMMLGVREGLSVLARRVIVGIIASSGITPNRLPASSAVETAVCMRSIEDSPSQPGAHTRCTHGTPAAVSACNTCRSRPSSKLPPAKSTPPVSESPPRSTAITLSICIALIASQIAAVFSDVICEAERSLALPLCGTMKSRGLPSMPRGQLISRRVEL
mmetsp:Transcript_71511/g.141789  ORF Transcript_71511/g.141789 Transcript_71511/m.141789 type:complete len:227 (-) Transcript_71511:165-845(-)